jgi:DNA gyrase subunit B
MLDAVEDNAEQENEEEEDDEDVKKTRTQKVSIQRYKGLGEMNPEELKETTMDATKRILKQVTVADGEGADKVFDMLMGTDVPARKSFIQNNAKFANLDV